MNKPRLGFLGVGWIGRHRLQAILDSNAAEVTAFADVSEAARQSTAELVPDARNCESFDELLALDLDGIVIATPSAEHAAQARRALESGRAVFCQKPLARSAEETRSVLSAARRANRLLSVDFSYRYTGGLRTIRDLVRSGELGHVYTANLIFHNAYGPDKAWFYERRSSGGGCIIDLGVHCIDSALWVLDFPHIQQVTSRLYAGGALLPANSDKVEDFALARIDLASGAALSIACSWNLSAGQDAVIRAEFYGTRAAAALGNVNGSFYDFEAQLFRKTARQTLTSPPDAWGGRAIVEFAKRLSEDNAYDTDADHLEQVAWAIDAIYGTPDTTQPVARSYDSVNASNASTSAGAA